MKCDTRLMIRMAAGLGVLAVIGYFALPQFRAFILGISPVLFALICPLAMIFMMKSMQSHQKEREATPAAPQAQEPVKEVEAKA